MHSRFFHLRNEGWSVDSESELEFAVLGLTEGFLDPWVRGRRAKPHWCGPTTASTRIQHMMSLCPQWGAEGAEQRVGPYDTPHPVRAGLVPDQSDAGRNPRSAGH